QSGLSSLKVIYYSAQLFRTARNHGSLTAAMTCVVWRWRICCMQPENGGWKSASSAPSTLYAFTLKNIYPSL
ncbi:hypothetical protein CUA57_25720, partial [Shigella sonnei]